MPKKANTKTGNKKLIILATVLVGIPIVVFLAYYWYVNGFEYRAAASRCGEANIIVGEKFPKDPVPRYTRPTDRDYHVPTGGGHYFCSEEEAQAAGYEAWLNEDGTYAD